ncbi:MAG TPA: hypothetical protein VES21_08255 [Nocardioidaceae bacterium]|nr:hypothetical protein [Nocardioidaceae bacterium]
MDKQINTRAAVTDGSPSSTETNLGGSAFATTLRRALLAVSAALVAVLGVMVPAQAQTPSQFDYHWSSGSNIIVVQEMGTLAKRWALSAVIRDWDAAATLRVHRGQCADFPAQHCVKVAAYNQEDSGAGGYTVITPGTDEPTLIYLNRAYWDWDTVDSHSVTCHEFGHAVGFTHDERSGCTSEDNRRTPSAWELDRAARAYQNAA